MSCSCTSQRTRDVYQKVTKNTTFYAVNERARGHYKGGWRTARHLCSIHYYYYYCYYCYYCYYYYCYYCYYYYCYYYYYCCKLLPLLLLLVLCTSYECIAGTRFPLRMWLA